MFKIIHALISWIAKWPLIANVRTRWTQVRRSLHPLNVFYKCGRLGLMVAICKIGLSELRKVDCWCSGNQDSHSWATQSSCVASLSLYTPLLDGAYTLHYWTEPIHSTIGWSLYTPLLDGAYLFAACSYSGSVATWTCRLHPTLSSAFLMAVWIP